MANATSLLEMIKKSKNKHTRTGNSVQLKEGKTTIRILAKPGTTDQFWFDLGVHWIKTEKNGKPVAVVGCRDEVFQEPCPICTAIAQATAAATSDPEIALIKEWKTKRTVLVNALVRSGPDKSEQPQVVELKPTAWADIAGMLATYQDEGVDLLDPAKGQDFVVERRGKGIDTTYSVFLAPRSQPVDESAYDSLHDLKAYAEAQFFRGDETKALTAIANVTGISVSAGNLIAAPARASALLTAPAAQVEDAEVAAAADAVIEAEADVEAIEEIAAAPAEPEESDDEREQREFREFQAAKRAREAKTAAAAPKPTVAKTAAVKPAVKPTVVKPAAPVAEEFNSALPQDEIDSLLEGL